jgi:hypothetical protein
MKALAVLVILAQFSITAHAQTGGSSRKAGFFFGGGAQKSIADIKDNGNEAKFEGWGYALEAGLDLPWNRTFGNTFSIEYKVAELTNTQKNPNSIENADLKSFGFRFGFILTKFGLGYGQSSDRAEIQQVSTTTGASSSNIKGDITEIYANYNIQMSNDYRFSLELQKRDGDLDTYQLDEIKLLMKFFVLSAF